MGKRTTKSIKGEEVDFDLLETKAKMENNKPKALEVRQREDFVHTKRRSRGRRAVMQKLRERKEAESKPARKTTSKKESSPKASESSGSKSTTKRKIVKKEGE